MRPLSDANPELKYDVSTDKPFKSTNDIRSLLNQNRPECENVGNSIYKRRLQFSPDESNGIESDDPTEIKSSRLLVAGNKRNLPKHQRPLTRYLPIMSVDLDLRHHIESAGHQVLLCPHVILDATSCRGCVQNSLSQHAVFAIFANPPNSISRYLHKLGATFHGWSRRWFLFDRQKMAFIYFADKSERKPRGGAYFSVYIFRYIRY